MIVHRVHKWSRPLLFAIAVAALAACGGKSEKSASESNPAASEPSGEPLERKTEVGPVTATVRLVPAAPTLGDALTLTLEVKAAPGVTVEMPTFGEALGRFQIIQFVPRETFEGDTRVATQVYTLQAPMSGKQRIPPLRIEFEDKRPGRAQGAPGDAGVPDTAGGAEEGIQEILTDELAITVASVLPDGAVAAELGEVHGKLDARGSSTLMTNVWLLGLAALVALVLGFFGIRAWLDKRRALRQISAYDAAMARLGKLEARGLPRPDEADDWYVELSSIIRRYLEDRYMLRAPELTTEEFLQVARGSGILSSEHRKLLSAFLVGCDRVKFARYEPEDSESEEALVSARSFLQDTQIAREAATEPAESPPATPTSRQSTTEESHGHA